MPSDTELVVVGAGPYGLSIAAHLNSPGCSFRIFGRPMAGWRDAMPQGMKLKSDGFASDLYDPMRTFPLKQYCLENGLPYADAGLPVPIKTFIDYGLAFQRKFVPNLETRDVVKIDKSPAGFRVHLDDGENFATRMVIVATGLNHFAYIPLALAALPPAFLSHSAQCTDPAKFARKNIAVVGAGASAIDLAVLLKEAGAQVTLIARAPKLKFHQPPGPRSLYDRLRAPMTRLGPGWKSLLCTQGPLLFHYLPLSARIRIVDRYLGPSGGWFTRAHFDRDQIKVCLNSSVATAEVSGTQARLIVHSGERQADIRVDHVIAATGYKTDIRNLPFLGSDIKDTLHLENDAPALSLNFESSLAGLYFVGVVAAHSFGPLLRFAAGADFTARHLTSHLKSLQGRLRSAPEPNNAVSAST